MSTSDKKLLRRQALRFAAASLFCGFFAAVYEHFSHGVYSNYMVWLFLWPLLGAAPAYGLTLLRSAPCPALAIRNLWASGVATLTVGSCLKGVFEIYGASAPLVKTYWYAGAGLLALAAVFYLRQPRPAAERC